MIITPNWKKSHTEETGSDIFDICDERVDAKLIDKIMWMWTSGIPVEAIAKYANLTIEDANTIIDTYQDAYV